MTEADHQIRRERLQRLLSTREAPTKPKGLAHDNEFDDADEAEAAGAARSASQAGASRAAGASADAAGPAFGMGGRFQGRLGQGVGAGGGMGAGLGGALRARLGQGGGGAGGLGALLGQAGGAGGLGARLGQGAAGGQRPGLGMGLGGGGPLGQRLGLGQLGAGGQAQGMGGGQGPQQDRPFLRQMLAQRMEQGGNPVGNVGPAEPPKGMPVAGGNVEATRAFLRDRIEKLQAQLAELDKSGSTTVEDATIIEETSAQGTKASSRDE